MIFDKIENAGSYKGISARLDKALEFIMNLDLDNLEVGKYELEGKDLFYMVAEYETLSLDEGKYESHINYIDIQLLVSGSESFRCASKDSQEVTVPYNSEKDIEFYTLSEGYDFKLVPGMFSIVMPTELHAPKLMAGKKENVKKVVVKILA